MQKMTEPVNKLCPKCHKDTAVRLVSAAGFQLKGTGWYVTDFKDKGKPSDMEEVSIEKDMEIIEVLVKFNLVPSNAEARRMVDQNAVKVNNEKIKDYHFKLKSGQEYLIQVGKRRFIKIK